MDAPSTKHGPGKSSPGSLVKVLALLFLIGIWSSHLPTTFAQNLGGKATVKPFKNFKTAEPYPPPHETQTKSLLEGGKGVLLPGGKTLLSDGVTLRTFSETNTPQIIVKIRECIYDTTTHSVNSAGPIEMQTADGKFTIEGTGFLWQQTNSSLIISNNVHTMIQAALLQTAGTNQAKVSNGPENGPLFIDSGQFSYDGPSGSGRGIWRDHVLVTGTNLVLHSELLAAEVPMNEREVRSLFADTNVVIDYMGVHATGKRMDYAPNDGSVRLSGPATWQAEQREGHGDELIIDRTNQIFQVNRHAWLKLPGQTLGESGFLSFSNSTAGISAPPAKRSVEIFCDRYEIRTNRAVFRENVRLEEHLGEMIRGRMSCQKVMTVNFAGTNELESLTADGDVIIEEKGEREDEDKRFTGGRAVYTHTNSILEISENPKWRAGSREGKGDLIQVNTKQNEMLVRGNASVTLPAQELASQFGTTNAPTHRPAGNDTNRFAKIFCEEYTLGTNTSVFLGGVYATHPEMNWSCEKLTIQLPTRGVTNIIAQQNVVFDLLSQQGKIHGKGDNAVYSFGLLDTITNGNVAINELKLMGTPAVFSNTNQVLENPVVIWDRAKNKLRLPGSDYRIQGTQLVNTNLFALPNKKLVK
jgi:lipopolysaccharide export system protein LptA